MKMEKTMIGLLLMMIIAVAAFNIIATLVMVVNDKGPDIAILRTLGATPAQIMGTFMVCLLYTSPSPRDLSTSRMPSSA